MIPTIYIILSFAFSSGLTFLIFATGVGGWILWLGVSAVLATFQILFSCYQGIRIFGDLVFLALLKFIIKIIRIIENLLDFHDHMKWRKQMRRVETFREWILYAKCADQDEGNMLWKETEEGFPMTQKLQQTISKLRNNRTSDNLTNLLYDLPGLVKRNYLGMDDHDLHSHCFTGTKSVITEFNEEIERCLDYVASVNDSLFSRQSKIEFFQNLSRNLGQTALCLSGGGSLSMYHMGVLRALIESGNYSKIHVISGTSGGSIACAQCACKTEQQLLDDVLVEDVATDYGHTGEQARQGIRWFPSLVHQIAHFAKTGFLVDNTEYQKTCKFYWGDITFREGYEITHKHVCISVTASRSGLRSGGSDKLLLNHLSTPHVLLRSAVAASCALPGIMAPNQLLCKHADGSIHPFDVDDVEWIDGSVQADVPFQRLSALFSVSNYIVSQVNFHVLPFMDHKIRGYVPKGFNFIRKLMSAIDLDLRHRSLILAKMELLPKLYGQDVSALFKQKYHGNVTIVPDMRVEDSLGIKAILQPSLEDMRIYIRGGRKACWPHLLRIRQLLVMESKLWKILEDLTGDRALSHPQSDRMMDANSSVPNNHFLSHPSVSDLILYKHLSTEHDKAKNLSDKKGKDDLINKLECEIARLRRLCVSNGIDVS